MLSGQHNSCRTSHRIHPIINLLSPLRMLSTAWGMVDAESVYCTALVYFAGSGYVGQVDIV